MSGARRSLRHPGAPAKRAIALPRFEGAAIRVEIRRSLGPYHASTSIPKRRILLDSGVLARRGEFERILIHELFHFVWVRLGNPARRDWESLIASEIASEISGDLGWSSEWRKEKLVAADVRFRSPRWRRYVCESFCDTAAWLYSGLVRHDEFTLRTSARRARRRWFADLFPPGGSINL